MCVHAVAAVLPELIPAPRVPSPVHNPAAKNMMPSIVLSVVEWGITKSRAVAIIKQKIIGVSMSASLINVNESNLSYALIFLPRLITAAYAKALSPIAGPILPMPTHNPLAIRRRLSLIVVTLADCPWIKSETRNAEIIGV